MLVGAVLGMMTGLFAAFTPWLRTSVAPATNKDAAFRALRVSFPAIFLMFILLLRSPSWRLRRLDVALACSELFRNCDAKADYLSLLTMLFLDADPGNHPDSVPRAPPQGTMSANTRGVFSNGYANAEKGPYLAEERQRTSTKCPRFGLMCPALRMCRVLQKSFRTGLCRLRTVPAINPREAYGVRAACRRFSGAGSSKKPYQLRFKPPAVSALARPQATAPRYLR
jgi:hypothetical protein